MPLARWHGSLRKNTNRGRAVLGLVGKSAQLESGTGAAIMAMTARDIAEFPLKSLQAEEVPELQEYLTDTGSEVRRLLDERKRVVVEGTQGFGLSLLQGGFWPKATSRDTTAAAFLAEAGLSPLDVDDVTLVIRCHPIRVAGDWGRCPARPRGKASPLRPGSRRISGSSRRSQHGFGGWVGSIPRSCAARYRRTSPLGS